MNFEKKDADVKPVTPAKPTQDQGSTQNTGAKNTDAHVDSKAFVEKDKAADPNGTPSSQKI